MSDPFRHVQPGQKVDHSAVRENAMRDAGRAYRDALNRFGADAQSRYFGTDIIRVLNQSGTDLPRFSVVGLEEPIFVPDEPDQLTAFLQEPTFRVSIPDADRHVGKFGILLEPARDGVAVKAWLSGVCICRVDMLVEDDRFADITDGGTDYLTSGGSGAAQILWTQGDGPYYGSGYETGEQWAIVRLGNTAEGGFRYVRLPSGGIAAGASGTVEFYENGSFTTLTGETATAFNSWSDAANPASRKGRVHFSGGRWQLDIWGCS
jgi:hypothetical protein